MPRPGLDFVESRGTALVPAQAAAQALFDAVRDLGVQLHEDGLDARTLQAKGSGWRWLVHPATADLIRREWPDLDRRLSRKARTHATGFFVPHAPETLVLRQARVTRLADVQTLLGAAESVGDQPLSDRFMAAVGPSTPSTVEPWLEGYERAAELRARMGWGDERLPDLRAWLERHNAHVERKRLPKMVDLASLRRGDRRGGIVLNSAARPGLRPAPPEAVHSRGRQARTRARLMGPDEAEQNDGSNARRASRDTGGDPGGIGSVDLAERLASGSILGMSEIHKRPRRHGWYA